MPTCWRPVQPPALREGVSPSCRIIPTFSITSRDEHLDVRYDALSHVALSGILRRLHQRSFAGHAYYRRESVCRPDIFPIDRLVKQLPGVGMLVAEHVEASAVFALLG